MVTIMCIFFFHEEFSSLSLKKKKVKGSFQSLKRYILCYFTILSSTEEFHEGGHYTNLVKSKQVDPIRGKAVD